MRPSIYRLASALALFLCIFAGLGAHVTVGLAQQTRVVAGNDWRDDRWGDRDHERYCEVREITLRADRGVIAIDGRTNGGIA